MFNILLAGVGGQGTVLASKIIAACAIKDGINAHTAETIGMAQRGGCVVSHVRIGDGCGSPLIPKGQADVIIGFEPAEAVRTLPYLKKGGAVIVNSAAVKPASDSLSGGGYSGEKMLEYLRGAEKEGMLSLTVVDGARIISELGGAKSLNVALLGAGAAAGKIGVTAAAVEEVIRATLNPKFLESNLKALNLGAEAVK